MSKTPNFYLFTGENTYALHQEVRRWKTTFAEKYGAENLLQLDAVGLTMSDLLDAVSVLPFIAEKRLVLCDGVPKIDKDQFALLLESIHPQTILLLYAAKLDKRLGVVKDMQAKAGEAKVFKPLPPAQIQAWIREFAKQRGASIAPAAVSTLLRIVGDDQWTLSNELAKLCAYTSTIDVPQVELLAVPSGSQVVWRLTDLIGGRRWQEALRFFNDQVERGEDSYGMWAILLNMTKNVAAIWACVQSGMTGDKAIMDATGVHFLSIRGLMPLVRSLDARRVRELVDLAANADIELKTGGYKYTAEHTGELSALAERLIVACA